MSESTSMASSVKAAQPGIEAEVKIAVPSTAADSTTPIPKIAVKAVIVRMAMRSVKGVSIRTPCIRSRNRFMRDWPAYRSPRGIGTGVTGMSRLTSVDE